MKFKSFSIMLALAFMVSCQKNSPENPEFKPELGDVKITVTLPSFPKAGLDGSSCVWEAGDSISVWDGHGVRVFKTQSGGTATAEFIGQAAKADKYYLVYPAEFCHSYADGKADVHISEVQQARPSNLTKASFACYGITSGSEAVLKPVGSVISVELAPGNKAVNEIVLRGSESDGLSGYLVITSEPGDVKPVYVGRKNYVKLVPQEGETSIKPGTYNVTVIPSDLQNGLDLEFGNEFYTPVSIHHDGIAHALSQGVRVSIGSKDPVSKLGGNEDDDKSADPASAYGLNFGSIVTSRHPRLVADANDFVRLRKYVADPLNTGTALVLLHNEALYYAETLAEHKTPVTSADADEALSRLLAFSYASLTSRGEGREDRYLALAKENLSAVCALPSWSSEGYQDCAKFQFAVAIAYDWLFYDLSSQERIAARTALETLGLGSCPQDHAAGSNSRCQVCNAGTLMSALAIYEKNKALSSAQIDKSVETILAALDGLYGNDGAYPEGYSRWNLGTGFQVAMTQALLSVFGNAAGLESHEGFTRTADCMLYMSDSVGPFPYADGGQDRVAPLLPMWWFAARQGKSTLAFNEMPLLLKGDYKNSSAFLAFAALYVNKYPGTDFSAPAAPSKDMWSGNSTLPAFAVRKGWNGDETDVYLAAKGGVEGVYGGHMDAGSFIFDMGGVRWIDEIVPDDLKAYEVKLSAAGKDFLSISQNSYRWDVFVMSSLAHPTISFANSVNGRLHHTDHSVSGKASLSSVIDGEAGKGGTFDLSPVFDGQVASAKRTIVLKNGEDVEVTDEITALPSMDASLVWTAPTRGKATVDDDCIELTYASSELYLSVSSSSTDVKPVLCDFGTVRPVGIWGWSARDWDQNITNRTIIGYKATIPAGTTVKLVSTISRHAPGQGSGGAEIERPEM